MRLRLCQPPTHLGSAETQGAGRSFHFRTHTGVEVDLVLEDRRGRLVGIEINAAGSVGARDLKGLRYLEREYPDSLVRGVVLYGGDEVVPFSERISAVPMSASWTGAGAERVG